MKKNFIVRSTVEIESAGEIYDLHNDFDCSCIIFNPISSSLVLSWVALVDERYLEICFESIDLLMLRGVNGGMPRKEDRRLSFMGYVHPEDLDLMDGFLPEDLAGEGFHFIFNFEGGLVVKLQCQSAKVTVKSGAITGSGSLPDRS